MDQSKEHGRKVCGIDTYSQTMQIFLCAFVVVFVFKL